MVIIGSDPRACKSTRVIRGYLYAPANISKLTYDAFTVKLGWGWHIPDRSVNLSNTSVAYGKQGVL